jgi:hypothetical protein
MISDAFNFEEFLKAMLNKDFSEIIKMAEQEAYDVENRLYKGGGGFQARKTGGLTYSKKVGEFIFFIRYGIRPSSTSNEDFAKYLPICNALIQRNQIKPSVLDLFK